MVGRTPGVGLSAEGALQAKALANGLAGMEIDAVLSSPLERARQTAAPIAAELGLTVEIDAGLNEIDFGEWTGADFASLEALPEWKTWNRVRSVARCPGGESMGAAQDRALAAVHRAADRYRQIILVSHQDVLKAILAHFLGLSLDYLDRFSLDTASRSVVTLFGDGGCRVEGINLRP